MQCDKHVVKMVLESAQILSTTHRVIDGDSRADVAGLYRKTHTNHPCSKWARESSSNYLWLCDHAMALATEYTHRYSRTHKSQLIIKWCRQNKPDILPEGSLGPFAQAMPEEFRGPDSVSAYRRYYAFKRKSVDMRWTARDPPEWLFQENSLILPNST